MYHHPDDQNINQIKLEIGLLKKDHQQMQSITDKLSLTIEKIQEMNGNLLRMIALHDQKHDNHQRVQDDLKENIKELHSRITTVTRELHDKIDEIEKTLGFKIDSLRNEIKKGNADDAAGDKESSIKSEFIQYKWMILGAVLALGWFLHNIDLKVFGTIMK
jgi:chromosome segregation ATPase